MYKRQGQQYKQFEKQKQGKYAEECMFIFEIPDERVEVDGEDKPRWLSSQMCIRDSTEVVPSISFLASSFGADGGT